MLRFHFLLLLGWITSAIAGRDFSSFSFQKLSCRRGIATRQFQRTQKTLSGFPGRLVTSEFTTLTQSNLFFRAREEEKLILKRKAAQERIPAWALKSLRKGRAFPFQIPISDNKHEGQEDEKTASVRINIRLLASEDLSTIVPLCVAEFGGGKASLRDLVSDFPWGGSLEAQGKFLWDWWDSFFLPSFIYWTFRLKIVNDNPQDHALLVATIQSLNCSQSHHVSFTRNDCKMVGMIELSKQPPEGTRNPTAYPLPLWYKELYCRIKQIPPPDGWITNVLISPEFRGQGFSKLLMAAAEGVARSWGCTLIHLHCDADSVSGKVPQGLYRSLGFEMVENEKSQFAWMGSEFSNKIYLVEDIPLLWFRKKLVDT